MNKVLELVILLYFQYALVQCLILKPHLKVRRVDKTTIAKKRQDTLDMCKIFNEETAKDNDVHTPVNIVKSYSRPHNARNRFKRSALRYAINPALNEDDEQRVEDIVDKLYDDVDGDEKINSKGNKTEQPKQPSRRFDFAPQMVLFGNKKTEKIINNDPYYVSKARWKYGIIPYFIDPKTYDAQLANQIMDAFDYVEKATCIRLQKIREKPVDQASMKNVNWVYITNPGGIRQCVHSNENRELDGVQMTVLGYDCMSQGDIVHEVMHILGFAHEHLRSDRDQYVSILWDNIKPGYRKYFDINGIPENMYNLETLPYDYASILHYPPRAFSRNGQVTIMTEQGVKIGQREGLSEIDLEKVGLIYSSECVERNREYLLKTCPSVVKAEIKPANISQQSITEYFDGRLWPYGIILYKFRDNMEFSAEERENIRAVFRHIEKETCIQFKDVGKEEQDTTLGKHWMQDDDAVIATLSNKKEKNTDDSEEKLTVTEDATLSNNKEKNTNNSEEKLTVTEHATLSNEKEKNTNYSEGKLTATEKLSMQDDDAVTESEKLSNKKEKQSFHLIDRLTLSVSSGKNNGTKLKLNENQNNEVNGQLSTESNDIGPNLALANKSPTNTSTSESSKRRSRLRGMEFTIKNFLKKGKNKIKKLERKVDKKIKSLTPKRRHAAASITLIRSVEPGCKCPEPGKPDGNAVLEVNEDCFNSVNDLLHYFVHVLGLDHQHNMYDRDSYLHIVWDNLTQEMKKDLQKKLPPAASLGFAYDYQSVMHYPWLEIKNGKTNVMYPIWNDGWSMGHWQGLSSTDVQKLNLLYFEQCLARGEQHSM